MNPQKKAVAHQQASEQQPVSHELTASAAHEFANAEEMLRHDALHTPLPPAIAERLRDSVAQMPAPPRPSWWRRLLGGSS